MDAHNKIQKVTDVANQHNWNVSVQTTNNSDTRFEFQCYTKYGQDFMFSVDMQDENIDTLIVNLEDYFQSFDPDYEAYLWIGDDGHGKNGAPYHIKDIVADMEDVEQKIYKLLQALELEFI